MSKKIVHLVAFLVLSCTSVFAQFGVNNPYFNVNDKGFGSGIGMVLPESVSAMAVQSDGKILIGGSFSEYNKQQAINLARILPDGQFDFSFSVGFNASNTIIHDIAVQPNGKILVVGNFLSFGSSTAKNIVRLNADGTIDNAFSSAIGQGTDNVIYDVLVDAIGNIFLAGEFTSFNSTSAPYFLKLNSAGVLDVVFQTGLGTGPNSTVFKIGRQSTGMIVLAGAFTEIDGVSFGQIGRIQINGEVDTGFNPGETGFSGGTIGSLSINAADQILLAGDFGFYNGINNTAGLILLKADGSYETLGFPIPQNIRSAIFTNDNKILIGGGFTNIDGESRIARLSLNGVVDPTFDAGSGPDGLISILLALADGNFLLSGNFNTYNSISRPVLTRINGNGLPDLNFNPRTSADAPILALAASPLFNRFYVGGLFTNYNGLLNTNGFAAIDPSGAIATGFSKPAGFDGFVNAIDVQSDGKIIIGGNFTIPGYNSRGIARLNTDGSLDLSFNPSGSGFPFNSFITDIEILNSGNILVAGGFPNYNGTVVPGGGLLMLSPSGALLTSFFAGGGANGNVFSIAENANGTRIAIGGIFTSFNGVARDGIAVIQPSGDLVSSFNPSSPAANLGLVTALAFLPSGDILVGGNNMNYGGLGKNNIVALLPTGAINTSYSAGVGTNLDGSVNTITVAPDGSAYIGGNFTTVNGSSHLNIARLNVNGTVDETYLPGSGASDEVFASALQNATGDYLLIGGNFLEHDGVGRNHLSSLMNTIEALPITLKYFRGRELGEKVELLWATEIESNNDYFTIERSADKQSWKEIGTVSGAGNSNRPITYRLIDPLPLKGVSFYRLKQTDLNGRFTYFDPITISRNATAEQKVSIFPNPVGSTLNLRLVENFPSKTTIRILDYNGRVVQTKSQLVGSQFELNVSNLPKGLYVVEVISGQQRIQTKMVKD